MARQVLPIVGAFVGAFFGAPQIGFMIGSIIGNAVDPQVIKGPSIGEGQQTTSQEGQPRPIVWGRGCVGGNIIARGELKKKIKRTRQGKGVGPITEEERLYMTYALRICEGPVDALIRVWEDDKLVFDARASGAQVKPEENRKYQELFRFYNGSEDQMPDPDLEVIFGSGDTPAYRGTSYIVFPNRDVTDRRGSVPNYRFEVASTATIIEYPDILSPTKQGSISADHDSAEVTGGSGLPASGNRGTLLVSRTGKYVSWPEYGGFKINRMSDDGSGYGVDLGYIPSLPGQWRPVTWHPQDDLLVCIREGDNAFHQILGFFRIIGDNIQLFSESEQIAIIHEAGVSFNPGGYKVIIYAGGYNNYVASFDLDTCRLTAITDVGTSAFPAELGSGYAGLLAWRNESQVASVSPNGIRLNTVQSDNTVTLEALLDDGFGWDVVFWSEDGTYLYVLKYNSGTSDIIRVFTVNPTPSGTYSHEFVEVSGITQPPSVFQGAAYSQARDLVIISSSTSGQPSPWLARVSGATVSPFTEQPTGEDGSYWIFTEASGYTAQPGYWPLASIISDIADRLQISPSKLDLTDIEDIEVAGLVAAGDYDGGNVVRSLQDVYFFDPSDYDRQIHFLKRGKPVVTSIAIDDMVADSYEYKRGSAIEYPRKIELMYQNSRIGYAAAKATVERISPDVQVSGDIRMEVPVVLTEDEAAQVADKQLKVAWAEAEGEVQISLPSEYDYLVPSDCLGVFMRESVRRVRVESIESADGILAITGKVDRQSAYTSVVTGIPLPDPTPPPPTIVGRTILAFMNLPALVDGHDFLGYYLAGTGQTSAWHGAIVQRKIFESDWEQVATIPVGACMGVTQTAIAAASEHYPDTTNRIRVMLFDASGEVPEQVSQDTLLRESNGAALCRPDGTAEIVQFRDVEEVSPGVFDLSYLIRGRLNSGSDAHSVGTLFVLLDGVVPVHAVTADIGVELTHRAVSYGEDPELATQHIDTYAPALSQTEFPVDLLTASMDTAGQIQVSWSPRERFGTDIMPVRSVNWAGYQVEATDGINTVSATVLTPSASLDGSVLSNPVTVSVTQLNRITGAGPAKEITIG